MIAIKHKLRRPSWSISLRTQEDFLFLCSAFVDDHFPSCQLQDVNYRFLLGDEPIPNSLQVEICYRRGIGWRLFGCNIWNGVYGTMEQFIRKTFPDLSDKPKVVYVKVEEDV
jgi:hypothetical protein